MVTAFLGGRFACFITRCARSFGTQCGDGPLRALALLKQEELEMNLSIDEIGDLSVIECKGRMMGSEAAFKFRDVVTSRKDARVIVVDLSEVGSVGGAALGILVFLQRWARHNNIQFKLFNPSRFVRERLDLVSPLSHFDIVTLNEMMALLGKADSRYAIAA